MSSISSYSPTFLSAKFSSCNRVSKSFAIENYPLFTTSSNFGSFQKAKNPLSQRLKTVHASASSPTLPTKEEQLKLVDEVKNRLASEHPDLPVGVNGRDDEDLIQWFLIDRKFDVENTVSKLSKAIEWRQEFQVSTLTAENVAEQAATGKAFLNEHFDKSGRPVIVVTASKHFPEDDPIPTQRLCVYLIEKAIAKMPPGEDKFLGIFDLRNFKPQNTDWGFVRFFIDLFFNYYPKRVGQVLFVDAPFYFQPGWNMIKPLLKKYASLVRFVNAEEVRSEYFTPETAPDTFRN